MRQPKRNTKVQKERFRNMMISYYAKKGMSANKIQEKLKAKGLGVRRKELLAKIRLKRTVRKTRFDTSKNIPIKYRKQNKQKIFVTKYIDMYSGSKTKDKDNFMYRVSFAINDVPVHNKYTSFLLQAFSLNANELNNKIGDFKKLLIQLTNAYLGYNYNALETWNHYNHYVATEFPTQIIKDTSILGRWYFKVEKNSAEGYSKSGSISNV